MVFVFVVTDPTGREFRTFLDRHRRLLRRLHRWTIRLAVPIASQDTQALHMSIATDFASAPLRPAVAEEFRWFCQVRRTMDDGSGSPLAFDAVRFAAARRAFSAPRVYAAYRAWRTGGESLIHELLSPRLHEAWSRADGRVEIHALGHQYQRLGPAVATA